MFLLKFQDAITIFMGIFVGAIPFILLGVVLSVLIGKYVKQEQIIKLIPKNKFGALISMTFLGFLLPVCECGNIPVAKKLLNKGLPLHLTITFLLSAPVINPVVIYATHIAFRETPQVTILRIVLTFSVAISIGYIFSHLKNSEKYIVEAKKTSHSHHSHSTAENVKTEFFEMTTVLIMGSIIASLIQLVLPRNIVSTIGSGPVSSVFAMGFLAFVVSICSNVDSFFALSYVNNFTQGSILTFLVLGPMLDIKAVVMMSTIFKKTMIFWLVTFIILLSLIPTMFINLFIS